MTAASLRALHRRTARRACPSRDADIGCPAHHTLGSLDGIPRLAASADVHFPIALFLVSLLFELIGRASDRDWWRKGAFAILIFSVLGAEVAVLSGDEAGEKAEAGGVPESAVHAHEEAAHVALYLGAGAVLMRALAAKAGRAGDAIGALCLAL